MMKSSVGCSPPGVCSTSQEMLRTSAAGGRDIYLSMMVLTGKLTHCVTTSMLKMMKRVYESLQIEKVSQRQIGVATC